MAKKDEVSIDLEGIKEEKAEEREPEIIIDDSSVKDKKVKVKIKQDATFYHGDRWYELKKGDSLTVMQSFKDYLQKMNLLDVL
jgi:hypothetical protein